MEKMKIYADEKTIKLQGVDEVYFPKNCIVCGKETENRIIKSHSGSFTRTKEYKKDYTFKLPICKECNANFNLKAGKSGVILFMGIISGISLAFLIYYLTYTLLLSIAVFIVLVIFPFLSYRAKIRPRVKLSDYIQMKVIPNEELVQFSFKDKQYTNYVYKVNQDHLKEQEKEDTRSLKEEKNPEVSRGKEELMSKTELSSDIEQKSTVPIKDLFDSKDVKDVNMVIPQVKRCPKCNKELKPEWKFCVFCSEPINDS